MIQLTLTLKMTTTQVVETSVTVNNKSPIHGYFGLPGSDGFGVIEADVTVIRVGVEIDSDVVTGDIIAERKVLVFIGVSNRMFKSKLAS